MAGMRYSPLRQTLLMTAVGVPNSYERALIGVRLGIRGARCQMVKSS
jgi:hypothetical protein